ncbi:MAG TPA: M28 family peptidase [Lunatimonas sp.]|nr:M28 family peptidase [Lunatimonas sp.]
MKTVRKAILFLFLLAPGFLIGQILDKEQLIKDITYLSSPKLGGRATLSAGNRLAQTYIAERFHDLELTSQFQDFIQYFTMKGGRRTQDQQNPANIIGFIPGTETDTLILVMAHYDHLGSKGKDVFLGADDNASGTAALLAFAAHFSVHRPKHSFLFAALDAEELGLLGSKALLADFPFPLDLIKVVVNMDMIGRSETNRLYAVGSRHYPQLKRYLLPIKENTSIDLYLGNDGGTGEKDWSNASDHGPFHAKGIPFIYFGVDDHEDYHKPTDSVDRIDLDFYTNATELILQVLLQIERDIL